jgi:hypothetical protein
MSHQYRPAASIVECQDDVVGRRPSGPVRGSQHKIEVQRMADIAVATRLSPAGDIDDDEFDPLALADGEQVRGRASGVIGSDSAVLVVTDRRVLLTREADDHVASVALSDLRTVRWEPSAQCNHDETDYRHGHGAEPGTRWGSLWLANAVDSVRLSLVVAHDGERIVELIRETHPNAVPHRRSRASRRNGPATTVRDHGSDARKVVPASIGRGPDAAEPATAVIPREQDTIVLSGPVITPQVDTAEPTEHASQPVPDTDAEPSVDAEPGAGAESEPSAPVADEAPSPAPSTSAPGARAKTDKDTGRHRPVKMSSAKTSSHSTRHALATGTTNKRTLLLAGLAVGLATVTFVGIQVANGLFGCTRASNAEAVADALTSAGPGDRICITSDLPSVRVTITKGGDADAPVTVEGKGLTLLGGLTVHADNVVVSGFQVQGDPKHAIQVRGNGINVENNTGASGRLIPAWE